MGSTSKDVLGTLASSRRAVQNAKFVVDEKKKAAEFAAGRKRDLKAGEALGKKFFGENSLGSVGSERSSAVQDILARRQSQLEGYTPEEQQAMRENNMKSVVQAQQAGSRDLARQQSRSGVRGALASAQQGAFGQQSQAQLADQERQLFLQQIAEKRGALDKFEGSQRTSEADEFGRKQFDIGQREKEKAGQLTTSLGVAGLGAGERAAAMQSILGDKALLGSERIAQMTKGKK